MASHDDEQEHEWTNRLVNETSPYLLQHAHNPVDWYPWGPEALARAREEDKPIFLSIGYSACHWCHVMERESFEDPDTAELMNQYFVNIKVDREERPDLDAIYMDAVQAMTGQGGWPMSVFLTPEGLPFYGGTYYPPEPRYGMSSFRQVLLGVANAYAEKRGDVVKQGQHLRDHISQRSALGSREGDLTLGILDQALEAALRYMDPRWGGFGEAPKFPQVMAVELVLRVAARTEHQGARTLLKRTLDRMARGGIYDHLGGGFARYSTDARWLAPHFEKMLYDNSQLARIYLHAWQYYGEPLYRDVAVETLEYVMREMTNELGGFYATQDADSEGEEGKFYVWEADEIRGLLEADEWRAVQAFYDVQPGGNWEGHSILWVPRDPDVVAHAIGMEVGAMEGLLRRARGKLFNARATRIPPGTDTKVITAWNGMMLTAFAEAARIVGDERYREVAVRNAEFLLTHLRSEDGTLLRTWKEGRAKIPAFLEDYANLVNGLVSLYEATFDPRWLDEASALVESMFTLFQDPAGGFFDTPSSGEALIFRPKDVVDNATPSGNAMAATALLRLGAYVGNERMLEAALSTLKLTGEAAGAHPLGFAQSLVALDWYLSTPVEFALVGDEEGQAPFMREIYTRYLPNKLVAGQTPHEDHGARIPLLAERTARSGQATAYLCRNFACQAPTTDPAELARQIDAARAT